MAIRIDQGTAPQYGRVTLPKGTYLSSPSTAADGILNGPQGTNPAQLNTGPISSVPVVPTTPVGGNPFLQTQQGQGAWQQATNPNESIWQIAKEWFTGTGRYGSNPDPIIKALQNPEAPQVGLLNTPPPGANANPFVGREPSSNPNYLPESDISSVIPGASAKEKHAVLQTMGYTRVYQAGVGFVWIQTGGGSPGEAMKAAGNQTDSRGRPQYVDPTSLEPGERVTLASGISMVGGTPYTDAGGTTVAQYAMTIPDNIGEDTKGRYKWATSVRKDDDGNWVRVYQRKLRKVYSRSHRKKQQQRTEDAQASVTLDNISQGELSQLVNLRADFG